jgi:hypothetical protein
MAAPDAWRDDWQLAFPHRYIGAPDLRGRDVTLTISRVDLEELEMFRAGKKERKKKLVLYFAELASRDAETEPTMLLCNKTNAGTIAGLYGKRVDDWTGERITLYPAEIEAFGKVQEAVRIRPKAPPQRTRARSPEESERAKQVQASEATPRDSSPAPAELEHDEGTTTDLAGLVRSLYKSLGTVLQHPERLPALREQVEALPDCPDRPILAKQLERAERLAKETP